MCAEGFRRTLVPSIPRHEIWSVFLHQALVALAAEAETKFLGQKLNQKALALSSSSLEVVPELLEGDPHQASPNSLTSMVRP